MGQWRARIIQSHYVGGGKVKVGDLVKVRNTSWQDYGIILEINGRFKWAEVYWIASGHSYSFFAEDLEVINGSG